jgi:hypothetical protein
VLPPRWSDRVKHALDARIGVSQAFAWTAAAGDLNEFFRCRGETSIEGGLADKVEPLIDVEQLSA